MKTNKVNEVLQFPDGQAFEEKLTAILANENAVENAVIALLDVDNFMHVNDDFGHEAGDQVLIQLGQYLQKGIEGSGEIFRIQGDEFGILFNTDLEKEDAFLQRIESTICNALRFAPVPMAAGQPYAAPRHVPRGAGHLHRRPSEVWPYEDRRESACGTGEVGRGDEGGAK